jgi:hypothetical protein
MPALNLDWHVDPEGGPSQQPAPLTGVVFGTDNVNSGRTEVCGSPRSSFRHFDRGPLPQRGARKDQREALAGHNQQEFTKVAKVKKIVRKDYTKDDIKVLKAHSKARTPIAKISKEMKRTVPALRAKAHQLGIGLGHQR